MITYSTGGGLSPGSASSLTFGARFHIFARMQLARKLWCGFAWAGMCACAPPAPPALTPNPDDQEVLVDSKPADDPFSGTWKTPLGGDHTQPPNDKTSEAQSAPAKPSEECHGTATKPLLDSLRRRGATSRVCFTALLRRGTEAKGQVKVALEISENGKVSGFDLEGDNPGDVEFTECIAEHFKVSFAKTPPDQGCVTVKIPLNFSVKLGT